MMKKVLLALVIILVVACGLVLLLFPLKEVRVTGCEMSSEEAVVETMMASGRTFSWSRARCIARMEALRMLILSIS